MSEEEPPRTALTVVPPRRRRPPGRTVQAVPHPTRNRADDLLDALELIAEYTWLPGCALTAAHEIVALARAAVERDYLARHAHHAEENDR